MSTNILIVEDEAITAMDIQNKLKNFGFNIAGIAYNGNKAIEKAEELKPDLILMDIKLDTGIDGIKCAEIIKKRFDIPIIYLTAHSDDKTLQRAKLTEPYGFIVKPINYRELKSNIETALYKYKMEKKVKESEKNLKTFLNAIYEPCFLIEPDGQIILANKAFANMFNMNPGQIIGSNFYDILKPPIGQRCKEFCQEIIKTKNSISFEGGNSEITIKHLVNPILDSKNNVSRLAVLTFNITEHKKMEKKLKQARDHLEEQVEKRTLELKEVIEELKLSNEELERFAYVASHDLQEPLRTIASFTQLLERRYKGKFDEDADEFMDYIVEAAIRMKEQIEGLLEYSRVATKGEEFEQVNLNLILNQTIIALNTSINESKAEITVDKLPDVIGDTGQLQRVFQNLISNAIKFRKEEEPIKIHISAIKKEYKNEYLFSVSDNGIGIEEPYTERIFTIFQRLHTRDVYEGTGIGLSIVKRIVERHEGHVWVESSFGVGSIFYFTIPVKTDPKADTIQSKLLDY